MNLNLSISLLLIIFLLICTFLFSANANDSIKNPKPHYALEKESNDELKALAFEVLKRKCNACHRKQNPFFIFNIKNMDRRAAKIQRMVYVEKRMPKGDDYNLTDEESHILKRWLNSKNL